MGYFNRDNKSDNRGNFGRPSFNNRGSDRQMHKATCSACNRECEVPFKPSGNKPVYCSNCFEKNRGSSDTRRSPERSFNQPRFEDRSRPPQNNEQYNSINAKLDKILALLTVRPSIKPIPVVPVAKPQDLPVLSEKPVIIVKKKKKAPKKTSLPSAV